MTTLVSFSTVWANLGQFKPTQMCRGGLACIGRHWLTLAMRLAIVGLRGGLFDTSKRANVARRTCAMTSYRFQKPIDIGPTPETFGGSNQGCVVRDGVGRHFWPEESESGKCADSGISLFCFQ